MAQNNMKFFSYIVISVVAVVVVVGFWLVGSPLEERTRKFDERRVNDLQLIQSEIMNYWRNKAELPKNLAVLNDDIRGLRIPKDPVTGQEYEYVVAASEKFSLCANFALSSDASKDNNSSWSTGPRYEVKTSYDAGYPSEVWAHGAGRVCFERTFDKELYKPYPQVSYPTGM